jgi:hypothetical protein
VDVSIQGSGVQIGQASAESGYVNTKVAEVRRDGNETTYRVTARVRPDTPTGSWYTSVWLTTNNPSMPHLRLPLTVEVEPPLAVTPAVAELGQVKVGSEVERKIVIRGDTPFRIKEIKGTDAQVSVQDSSSDSKPMHLLTVKFKPQNPGGLARTLRIITDLKDSGDVAIQATALAVP